MHRRDALWQVERATRFAGPLLDNIPEGDEKSPLAQMTPEERWSPTSMAPGSQSARILCRTGGRTCVARAFCQRRI